MRGGEGLSVCVNTQTPVVQFLAEDLTEGRWSPNAPEVDLEQLKEGVDYCLSPGGVTRMVLPLVQRLRMAGALGSTHWVSLCPRGPPHARFHGIDLHSISMAQYRMAGYGSIKEAFWRIAHGLRPERPTSDLLWTPDFSQYAYYNRLTAELLGKLDRRHDFDLFYIHDFQQLPIGGMLDPVKPRIFRWHIPFETEMVPDEWRATFQEYLGRYDLVIVSTDRYLEALRNFGYRGPARRLYPYVDPNEYTRPAPEKVAATVARWGIRPVDEVVLVVARMDPAKGQDRVLRAFGRVARRFPRAKLVLVGNGSFSSASAGLGLSKGARWREGLERLTRALGLEDHVIFTGHVSQFELDCLYERCRFTVLPSSREGFGLVVIESFLHRRAALVTSEAGVTELICPWENGVIFDPEDEDSLAGDMEVLLGGDGETERRLGQAGFETARQCSLDVAAQQEARLMAEVVEA